MLLIYNLTQKPLFFKSLTLASLIIIFFITPVSNNQLVNEFQSILMTCGLFLIIIYIFLTSLVTSIKKNIKKIYDVVIKIGFLFIITNYIVAQIGDKAILYFLGHPETQFLFGILIVLILSSSTYILNSIFTSNEVSPDHLALLPSNQVAYQKSKSMTQHDISIVAAHETGHLLLNYLYGEFPDSFRAEIFYSNPGLALGFVSYIDNDNISSYKDYDLWRMYVLLSGQLGESFLVNINTNGSTSDYEKWQKLAIRHLENQYEGFYFLNPKNDLELNHNLEKLNILKTQQSENILRFMEVNKEVMLDLYNKLVEKRVLYCDELNFYFDKLNYLENMPYPNGKQFIKINT